MAVLPSCGAIKEVPYALDCTPSTCRGCCDTQDRCQPGNTLEACGAYGRACAACGDVSTCGLGCVPAYADRVVVRWTLAGKSCTPDLGIVVATGVVRDLRTSATVWSSGLCQNGEVRFSHVAWGPKALELQARTPLGNLQYRTSQSLDVFSANVETTADLQPVPP